MELHQVRYFLATCETLNITKAAEACNISQPALTKALRLLETEMGGPLLDRQSRPMRLTELGNHLKSKFRQLNDVSQEISAQAKLFSNLESAVHTLGILSTLGEHRFLPMLEGLQRASSGISLSLKVVPQSHLVSYVRSGILELVVIADTLSCTDGLEVVPLFEEEYFLGMPPDHPLTKINRIELSDLEGVDFVRRIHCELNDYMDSLFTQHAISVKNRLATDQDAIARKMVHAGLGLSIMPESVCHGLSDFRPISDTKLRRKIVLTSMAGRKLSPSAKRIKEVILSRWQETRFAT